MGGSLYEPINVYKPLAPDIGIVDGPFEYLIIAGIRLPLPFTTRMTVVRLSNGDLFLHSPIKFDDGLAEELRGLERVRHLVSRNQFHYAHIGEWARAFPGSISWASPRVRQRARARRVDVDFARDLDADAPEEWRGQIDQLLFPGGYFKEFIFFHTASKTLILTDTVIDIELDKVSEPWRTATKLSGMYHPYGQIFFGMRLPLLLQRGKAKAAIGRMRSWQAQRILLSHGRYFDSKADEVVQRIFGGSTGSGIRHVSRERPLLRKLDNHLLRVADLDAAISFYRDKLGHRLLWRIGEAAGFALPETDAELVVHLKTDIVVADVDRAFALFLIAGGEGVQRPFDIAIGRCARVRDPIGNELVLLDQSKGRLATDVDGRVEPRPLRDDDEQSS